MITTPLTPDAEEEAHDGGGRLAETVAGSSGGVTKTELPSVST